MENLLEDYILEVLGGHPSGVVWTLADRARSHLERTRRDLLRAVKHATSEGDTQRARDLQKTAWEVDLALRYLRRV